MAFLHKGRPCVTQLLCYVLDAGKETDVMYLDFSKACDSVPHQRLLHKLSLFGICGSLYDWFSDYLISGTQCVLPDGAYSTWVPVTSGVAQGRF